MMMASSGRLSVISSFLSTSCRSLRTVQQMQPFIISTISSSVSTLLRVLMSASSTPTSPNSFSMTATCVAVRAGVWRVACGGGCGGDGGRGSERRATSGRVPRIRQRDPAPHSCGCGQWLQRARTFSPRLLSRMWLSRVVLPEPRKPVRTVTGTPFRLRVRGAILDLCGNWGRRANGRGEMARESRAREGGAEHGAIMIAPNIPARTHGECAFGRGGMRGVCGGRGCRLATAIRRERSGRNPALRGPLQLAALAAPRDSTCALTMVRSKSRDSVLCACTAPEEQTATGRRYESPRAR
jgi:hypothetical protein